MTDSYIRVETQDGVATLTINKRPLNVVDMAALHQLESVLVELSRDESMRVLILRAAGGASLFICAPNELAALALRGAFTQHAITGRAFLNERRHAFERLPRCVMG